jgi:hypothetical protein
MYNPNDPHAAFQQLAAQAMAASSAMTANQQFNNEEENNGGVPQPDDNDHTKYIAGSAGQSGGNRQQNYWSAAAGARGGQHRGSTYTRFSMPPSIIKPANINNNKDGDRPSSSFRPDSAAATGVPPLPTQQHRPYRPSTQSRRSEQVYAARRSGATTAFGRRSVATARGSTYSATTTDTADLWSGEDVDDLDWDVDSGHSTPRSPAARFWRWFWICVPFIISLIFITAGVLYLVYGSDQLVSNLQIWRMCFFIAGLPVIWWIGEGVTLGSVWIVERSKLFKMQNALYFAYAVRVRSFYLFIFYSAPHPLSASFTKLIFLSFAAPFGECITSCLGVRLVGVSNDCVDYFTRFRGQRSIPSCTKNLGMCHFIYDCESNKDVASQDAVIEIQ